MAEFSKILLGGHVSTSGGISSAPDRSKSFGFRTFQVFSKNQMQWNAKPLDPQEVEKFREKNEMNSQEKIMVHASYLLNTGTSDPVLRSKVIDGFRVEIDRADTLGISNLVFHPGSRGKASLEQGIINVAETLNSVMNRNQHVNVLLETAAGQGGSIGHTFGQLGEILDRVEIKERIGVCFDTCHVWASGYDIRTAKGYDAVIQEFDDAIGLPRLKAFHLNDSKKGMGSHVDRHEQIGLGTLGVEGIANFVNDARFNSVPMVFETPKGEEGYDQDIAAVVSVMIKS
ncbi:MAG: hypothetical protein B2I17_08310 [Thermoplasmatales archaeon B_DKE]|nr:MAG: hypothetical protein B2I17_08310 [Thermoplasmatales archaeon B_DKE]